MHSHEGPVHGSTTKYPLVEGYSTSIVILSCLQLSTSPGPGRTVIALFGLINALTKSSQKPVISYGARQCTSLYSIKLATFSFIYYHCASLVNGLVNSGSHSVTWKLEFGFWWSRARNFRNCWIEKVLQHHQSYETASGSVDVAGFVLGSFIAVTPGS